MIIISIYLGGASGKNSSTNQNAGIYIIYTVGCCSNKESYPVTF
jgi:hypothetical protein